jgi:superfamily II DNA or RNA helicase
MLEIKRRLTIHPRQTFHGAGAKDPLPVELFQHDRERGLLGVPRQWYFDTARRDNKIDVQVADGLPIGLDSRIVQDGPYIEQATASRTVVDALTKADNTMGVILQAGCGFGKTVVALDIIDKLRRKALIVVHKEFLVDQWENRIREFLPGARIGIIRQNRCEYEDVDISIALIQSLSQREYPGEMYRAFGTLVSDELHRVGAASWANVIPKFSARYRLGLTATPRRKDGAENVFFWHVGEIIYKAKTEALSVKARRVYTDFSVNSDKIPVPTFLNMMAANQFRNRLIVDRLTEAVDAGRKILVMGERLEGLENIKLDFENRRPDVVTGLYVGEWFVSTEDKGKKIGRRKATRKKRKVKRDELVESEKAQVIFATKQMVEEGLDIWDLDTLFLASPLSDVEQAVGRIRRRPPKGKSKKEPIVVDFVDHETVLGRKRLKYRERFYKSIGALAEQQTSMPLRRRA